LSSAARHAAAAIIDTQSVTFALPDRPFSDDDVDAHGQKFAVVVDAAPGS
jgi:hypothetical protein